LVALEDPEMMRARLRDAAEGGPPPTRAELLQLAETWGLMKRARGRPRTPPVAARSKAHEVAYTFIKFLAQKKGSKWAVYETAMKHDCKERTVLDCLTAALAIPDEKIQRVLGKKRHRK
jgi:hypothetical protein